MEYASIFLKKPIVKYAFILLFGFFTISRIVQIVNQFETTKGIDFRNVYLGAYMMLHDQNPYDDPLLRSTWESIVVQEGFVDKVTTKPGLPHVPLFYQPYALVLFMPLVSLPYSVAMPLWIGLCVLMVVGLTIGLLRLTNFSLSTKILIFLFLAGSTLLRPLVLVGQPTALSILTGFLSLYYYKKGNIPLTTLFLFLTCFKPTLAIPFVVFFMIRLQWKALFAAGFLLVAMNVILFMAGFDLVQLYKDNLLLVQEYQRLHLLSTNDVKQYVDDTRYSTELMIIPQYYFNGFYKIAPLIMLPLFGLISLWLFLNDTSGRLRQRKEKMSDVKLFMILATASLILFYHLYYDQVLVLPLLFMLPSKLKKLDVLLIGFLVVAFVPVHGIFERLDHYSVLWLFKPVALSGLLLWIWMREDKEFNFVPNAFGQATNR